MGSNKRRRNGIGTVSIDTLSLNTKEIKLRTYRVPWTHEVRPLAQPMALMGYLGSFPMVLLHQPKINPHGHHVSIVQSTNLLEALEPPHIPFLGAYMAASSLPCFLWGMMF